MGALRHSIRGLLHARGGARTPYDVPVVSASLLILAMPFALPRSAHAEPDACMTDPANVITCSGDQSAGVVREAVPPIATLRVQDLDAAVTPATGDAVRFYSVRGGNLDVRAGSAAEVIGIETHGDDARGILVDSVGQPAPPAVDPFLGVPLPGSPNVSGGVVTIESFGSIATDGQRAHGIAGSSRTSGYPEAMIDELEQYQGAGITFALTQAADPGDPDATPLVPDPVTGATIAGRVAVVQENSDGLLEFVEYAGTAGEFTLFGDGRFAFDPGDDFDDLAVGESRSVSVRVTVDGYRDGGAPRLVGENGELVAVVTKTAEGANGAPDTFEVVASASFETFGTSTRPAGENLVWPDVVSYVRGLAADAQGAGGAGNSVIVRHLAGEITTRGAAAHGIVAESRGQAGGRGDDGGGFFTFGGDEPTGGGDGNFGGDVTVRADGTITIEHELALDPNVDQRGLAAAGVFAHSQGGHGGRGGDGGTYYYGRQGGAGGSGALVEVLGSGTITTAGHYGVGILALSEGGDGGDGGAGAELTGGAPGGAGGVAGNVNVHGDWNITTRGDEAYGIWAKSVGGDAGTGGSGGWLIGAPGGGGVGSNGGDVALVSGGHVETFGTDAFALFGQSVGGFGGSGGRGRGIFYSRGGSGDSAGSGGAVSVTNDSGGELTTHGTGAHALVALSVGGGGGAGGGSAGIVAVGGSGASGGHGGVTTANNFGSIATFGDFARGVHAQSVGGGGGDGGNAGGIGTIGGTGSGTSDGGAVLVTNLGTIETGAVDEDGAVFAGAWSEAIFAQSIGGGGGSGGSSAGWFSIGGGGGGGGNGDTVTVDNGGALRTRGDDASAIVAQSVGGGGGSGGNSVAVGGFGSLAIGGGGAAGGKGGVVSVTSAEGAIETLGDRARGIDAQSVGGGGGRGGFAISASAGAVVSVAIGVGGTGGGGGDADLVGVTNASAIRTEGSDAQGLFAQSIGGGGGSGGFSLAGAGTDGVGVALSFGGEGGSGGDGKRVEVANGGEIETSGLRSVGLFAQSIGGGGGNGGFSVAGSGGGLGAFALGVGGKGGGGGNSAEVDVTNTAAITTRGREAHGVQAQSVGGGGGNGGFSLSGAIAVGGTAVTVGVGGSGGGGGDAAGVQVVNTGDLRSEGDAANGIHAQSIGGGGGNGGFSIAGSLLGAQNLGVTVGGSGEEGGAGGDVVVDNRGNIATLGKESHGIRAQSTSDGGGDGGLALSGSLGGPGAKNLAVTVGGDGGKGGRAGDVAVGSMGAIETAGEAAHGIYATSVGGGGGNGGASVSVGFGIGGEKSWNANLSVSVGGSGGEGGAVRVGAEDAPVQGEIRTAGDDSHGIFAQSIGGGGGSGGSATSINIDVDRPAQQGAEGGNTLSSSVAVGGPGGSGNKASTVDVDNASAIATLGAQSHGIYAQSIGGGGGNGGRSAALSLSTSDLMPWKETQGDNYGLDVSVGGPGGDGNTGGAVTVRNSGDISTAGALSRGIVAQSVGGGGGSGAQGILGSGVDWLDDALDTLSPMQMAFELKGIVEKPKESLPTSATISVGGDGGNSADAASVRVENAGTITTAGLSGHAIFAQSIGGGGGEAQLYARGTGEGAEAAVGIGLVGEIAIAGKGGIAGNGADLDVVHTGRLETAGHAASGIFAQSIGGGGGQAGSVSGGFADLSSIGLGLAFGRDGGSAGNGGNVTVESDGEIATTGGAAVAVFAQSVGGGGGIVGDVGGIAFAGGVGGNGAGGAVTVRHAGGVLTSGAAAHGIMAQSIGGSAAGTYSGRGGAVAVTIDGTVDVAGADASGVLAQSLGLAGNGEVTVTIADGAVVRGGLGLGAGVRLLDGGANRITNGGTVEARSGLAIAAAAGDDTVENHGRIVGNVDLGAGANRFVNGAGAELVAGDSIVLGAGNALVNSGVVSPGGSGVFAQTIVDGDFEQLEPGTLLLDVDVRHATADFVTVTGSASLDGSVAIAASEAGYAKPGAFTLPILSAAALDADGLSLDFARSAVAQYALAASGTELALEYAVDFSVAGLGPNQAALGDYVNAVQLAGGSSAFAPIAAHLFGLPDAAALGAAYDELSPDVHGGVGAVALSAAAELGDAMMSCPTVTADARFGLEDECNWIRVAARDFTHDRTAYSPGFTERTSGLSGGLQRQVADDTYVGFALSYEVSRLHSGARYDSDGDRYQAGVTMKRNANRNTFALGFSAGFGSYDSTRFVSLPVADVRLTSEQDLRYLALRGRFAHTMEYDGVYVQPLVDVQLTRSHVGSFTEHGLGTTNLAVGSQRETHLVVNPAVELGAELGARDGRATHLFGRLGAVRYPSGVTPSMDASFVAAPPGITPFATSNGMDRTFVEAAFGVSLLESDGLDLRFEMAAQFGENSRQRSGQLKFAMPVGRD